MSSLSRAAWRYVQAPHNANAHSNFYVRLHCLNDVDKIVKFAELFFGQPLISVPAYRRASFLRPDDAQLYVREGFACYSCGEDEMARECIAEARKHADETIELLELEALLEPSLEKRRTMYAKILDICPDHKGTFDYLVMLRDPDAREHDH
jgi:hypothetical protein